MSLFQNSVVSKYLKNQNATLLVQKWEAYKNHFLNLKVQEDIKGLKEEQYQGEFLEDLFVKILGYTKPASSTETKFNLTTEYKNVKDSKKADGAIIINDKVIAVIELKGTNTTDLGKIETQAFGYKNNQPDCVYVITSNFEKIRFYIDNAIEFLEFNLFQLTKTEFELLYLCLAYDNLSKGIAKTIKDESVSQEDVITKKLYKDYSLFKRELFQNLVALNPQYEPIELFKKSQKLLDRFLFIFFAEDRNLLPTNLIFRINKEWQNLRTMRIEVSLYDRYKIYFNDLNSGAKVQLPAFSQTTSNVVEEHQIFAYNGGLFKADDILDHIKIDDAVLFKHTENLSNYDFASEVDVNILGHIFENSLNELDEIKAQLEGESIDKTKTKRKKDGVFYTPKYITKYIVENTIGKLCEEKKTELQLVDEDYTTDKKRQKKTLQALIDKVETYRSWLLQLTICDPACGSGAFLNQALDFLIAQHQYIDELKAKLFGDTFVLSDVENSILENNLFGVDLNEESVEIAKLSLWLRTAQPNRKLNDLSNNIQCGNSLIDDVAVAGDKAFNWQTAFEKVFAKGGFDVIIGNPPYVLCQPSNTNEITLDYYKKFEVASYKIDLFHLFFEKSITLLKEKGKLGFITPNTYLTNKYIQKLRNYILNNTSIETIVNYEDSVFVDAGVDVATIILNKKENLKTNVYTSNKGNLTFIKSLNQNEWLDDVDNIFNLNNEFTFKFIDCIKVDNICSVTFGLQTKDKSTYVLENKVSEEWENCYTGSDINRFNLKESTLFFKNNPKEVKAGGSWNMDIHHSKKIVVRQVGNPEPIFAFDNFGYATLNTMYSIVVKDDTFSYYYLLAILNSTLIKFYFLSKYSDGKQLFPKVKGFQLKELPIKNSSIENQKPFIEKVELMLSLNKTLQQQQAKVINMLQRDYGLTKPTKKLDTWYELTVQDFFKELAKAKIVLSAIQKDEVQEYFETYQKQAVATKNQITATDKQIDAMVYELYGLSNEEIEIVENS
ncbi:putative type II endonuclease-methyltransferase fusion protein [Flavobacterium psychrophilum]|uniref:Eco57I restriction-modification methylase domain-containing protein n=1 Tax=Flavobacterium psychrophilum TaxID=96345 RepID=UPI000B7C53DE|nr:TaqI-like C-terminal specificity domain-containing protein [Flavobacterium psychrophilum]SNB09315.1 putative type II endonuclease-methyltransferase fusion protein [Flavobacterium psychrophilum]SNB96801.1 putative type II endonuclease-methyltransferase fusion protein [Flavobacterium psychrophilum]